MTVQKITLSASRDIPFNRLCLSQSNVRRIKAGVSIEQLAEDIARRTLLQSITVRPVLDADGAETGMFEIPAGGRRYRALELLVRAKRLSRTAPVPCVVRTEGLAEEDSLAENVQRAPLHPLDQFRAFQALRERGKSEEEIAAAFFVSVNVVKQRLRLAAVAPALLDLYAEDGMSLDQLMAFSVCPEHERQAQVWEAIQRGYNKEPYQIRRMLTEGAVRASDKRAQYAGEDYLAAGGAAMRDLFQPDDGGWLQDVGLLERLVAEKLERDADAVRAEGWKWIEVALDFPYGHTYGLRHVPGTSALTEEEAASVEALKAEADAIEESYADAEEYPEEVDARLGEIEAALAELESRPAVWDAEDIARAGAFVSIDGSGHLRVERGYVRPEDDIAVDEGEKEGADAPESGTATPGTGKSAATAPQPEPSEDDEPDGIRPLPDRLLTELTAWRTLALREAIGNDPATAFLAALHALCLRLFYMTAAETCLELFPKTIIFGAHAPGLADTDLAARVDARHIAWAETMPKDPDDLWDSLTSFDSDSREALFAHCVALTVNGLYEPYNRRPKALAHADRLATTVSLDMVAAGWSPTGGNYLGRVTKVRILEAVREAKGDAEAQRLEGRKKPDMVAAAEAALQGTGWLPEPLRTATVADIAIDDDPIPPFEPDVAIPAANDGETAIGESSDPADTDPATEAPPAVAAE